MRLRSARVTASVRLATSNLNGLFLMIDLFAAGLSVNSSQRCARGIHHRAVIELTIYNVSCASNQRKVRKTIGGRLWPSAINRPGAVDLGKHPWVEDIIDGVDLDLVNNETNVNV